MLSYLQYRRIGQAVQRQIDRDQEKARNLSAHTKQHGIRPREPNESLEDSPENADTLKGEGVPLEREESTATEDEDSYPVGSDANEMSRIPTHRTNYSERTALGYSLTGVNARMLQTHESEVGHVFVVEWEGPDDPLKPPNWSTTTRTWATLVVSFVAVSGTAASSIDAAVLPQYAAYWGISEVAGSLATAMYLVGFAVGSQFAGPFSETFGRNIIYIVT